MAWTTLVVTSCCLLGQAAAPPTARVDGQISEPASNAAGAAAPNPAAELLTALLTPPEELKIAGRWQSLVDALAGTSDRQQQVELTQAYWRVSAALVEVRCVWEQQQTLAQLTSRVTELPQLSAGRDEAMWQLQARMTAALARRHEAEVNLSAAQYELAQRQNRTAADALPLPSDLPHVGTYKTFFDQIYASRTAPPQARLIDRLLPLRREAIDAHARAVVSAEDALAAAEDSFGKAGADVTGVVSRCQELLQRRLAFLTAVRQYNDDIAAYALPVAPQGLSGESLVSILIKTGRGHEAAARQPQRAPAAITPTTAIDPSGGASSAVFQEPLPTAPPQLQPTPAAPGGVRFGEPTLAPPRDVRPGEPTPARQRSELPPQSRSWPVQPTSAFGPLEVHKVAAAGASELYPGLVNLEKPKRAQELANLLHWDRGLDKNAGTPLGLADCIGGVAEAQRRQALEAYWRTREQMARCQVLAQTLEQLDGLSPAALRHRQQPGGAETMLRLRAERTAAAAALAESRVALAGEQFTLTVLMRRPLDGGWLLPTTAPHGGRYRLKFENQPPGLAESLPLRRLATTIPGYHGALADRAESVVVADALRATLSSRFDAATMPIDKPLAAISVQTQETLAFLATLTRYNAEIAAYALAVLPPQTPAPALVSALVVEKPAARM